MIRDKSERGYSIYDKCLGGKIRFEIMSIHEIVI